MGGRGGSWDVAAYAYPCLEGLVDADGDDDDDGDERRLWFVLAGCRARKL